MWETFSGCEEKSYELQRREAIISSINMGSLLYLVKTINVPYDFFYFYLYKLQTLWWQNKSWTMHTLFLTLDIKKERKKNYYRIQEFTWYPFFVCVFARSCEGTGQQWSSLSFPLLTQGSWAALRPPGTNVPGQPSVVAYSTWSLHLPSRTTFYKNLYIGNITTLSTIGESDGKL